ncbi:MAG: peptide synthase, partial [Phycisphaerae bacterium]
VGVTRQGKMRPVVCIELLPGTGRGDRRQLLEQLRTLAAQHPHTKDISDFLIHRRFPVDIRHNAKIGREKLTLWAERKLP